VNELTHEQREELSEAFDLFDKDGDGTISAKELIVVMRSIGLDSSIEEIQHMMDEIVPGNAGEIEFDGFMTLMAKKIKETEVEDELKETFKTIDRGNKGYYDLDDLRAMVSQYGERISEEEIVKMFEEQDQNNNKRITFDEFINIIKAK
jgi:Ca2+-binding EF-hand superfamily protein